MLFWIIARLGLLSSERVAFHGLGRRQSSWSTMVVAYGGAALVLWLGALFMGSVDFISAAFGPGSVYAVSFTLYTMALSRGEVGQVSAWANATPVLLFLWQPTGTGWAWLAVAGFALGALWLGGLRRGEVNSAVVWMLLSDVVLIIGRLLDVSHRAFDPIAYAASIYLVVTGWMVLAMFFLGQGRATMRLIQRRPLWSLFAAAANGGSYLTLFSLLKLMPVTLIEAISALAGVGATIIGVLWFHETGRRRKILASTVMTLATILLLYDHRGMLRVQ